MTAAQEAIGPAGAGSVAGPSPQATQPTRRPQCPPPAVVGAKGKGPLVPTIPRLTPSDDEDLEDTIPLAALARRAGTRHRHASSTPNPDGSTPPSRGRPTPVPASNRAPRAAFSVGPVPHPSAAAPKRSDELGGAGSGLPNFLHPLSFCVSLGPSKYASCMFYLSCIY
jgi:hypothetical protein